MHEDAGRAVNPEKHGRGVEQAWRMLDVLASVGADRFDVTWTDIDGSKRGYCGAESKKELQQRMPWLLRSAIQYRHNLIVRPRGGRAELVQLDDLRGPGLERVREVAFLILMTSPGNHQAWVAVEESEWNLARRLRQGSGADANASGATRVAGSMNFKRRYAPEFPRVEMVEARAGRVVLGTELEAAGLLAAPGHSPDMHRSSAGENGRRKAWPSYERCLQNAPLAHDGERPDVSRADFTFCLLAIDWGWSMAETCERLLQKSPKAGRNGKAYAWRTVHAADAAVQRRCVKSREFLGRSGH